MEIKYLLQSLVRYFRRAVMENWVVLEIEGKLAAIHSTLVLFEAEKIQSASEAFN